MTFLLTVLMLVAPGDYKPIPPEAIKPGLDAVMAVTGDESKPDVRAAIKFGSVLVSPTLKTLREVRELAKSEETNQAWNRFIDLLNEGRLIELKFGTRVRVLNILEKDIAEIMIRSGPSTGKIAYTGLNSFCYEGGFAPGKWQTVPLIEVKPGYVGFLGHAQADVSSLGKVYVFRDSAAYQEALLLFSELKNKDELEVLCVAMEVNGKAFAPPAGTKVKVLRVNKNKTLDIQILDGKFESREGVVVPGNLCIAKASVKSWVPAGDKLKKGYLGVLGSSTPIKPGETQFIAINDTFHKKLMDLVENEKNDFEFVRRLQGAVAKGQVMEVPFGTKLKVLSNEKENGSVDIIILSGKYANRKGVLGSHLVGNKE